MKAHLALAVVGIVLGASLLVWADPGAEIPRPKHTLEEALKLARAQFAEDAKAFVASGEKPEDWIITRVVFVPTDEQKRAEPWLWMITFTHRINNDYSCFISVLPDGKVTSTGITGG
jgi:hypothetical protein